MQKLKTLYKNLIPDKKPKLTKEQKKALQKELVNLEERLAWFIRKKVNQKNNDCK